MERELIPLGVFQGLPALVLDGADALSVGPDWMSARARGQRGPLVLRRVGFPASDVALERLLSSREEDTLVWRVVQVGESWPSTPVWTVLDLTGLLGGEVALDPGMTRAALGDLPPMGRAQELVVRTARVSALVLDELHAWLDPHHAWLVVPAAELANATRVTSRCVTSWGAREG